eukprot:c12055_g1_i1 orf=191-376(+)
MTVFKGEGRSKEGGKKKKKNLYFSLLSSLCRQFYPQAADSAEYRLYAAKLALAELINHVED